MIAAGSVIDHRFEIIELIGEGGMGTVYRARHTNMDRAIALKLLKMSLVKEEEKVARFRNEARVLSGLDHPNIIAVHAVGIADTGQPYIAMDFVTGESLSDIIKQRGALPQLEAIDICKQICAGLQYAHSNNIIHRDVKPSNIIIHRTADGGMVAKLVDFGIAKMLDADVGEQKLTQTGMAIGSVFYLSPGMFEGRAAEPSSDIYALGCSLYEMLTGVPPFEAETVFEAALKHKLESAQPVNERNSKAHISKELQSIIECMLQKDTRLRYQSADQLAEDLECLTCKRPLVYASMHSTADGGAALQTQHRAWLPRKAARIGIIAATVIAGLAAVAAVIFHSSAFNPFASHSDPAEMVNKAVRAEALTQGPRELAKDYYADCERATDAADTSKDPILRTRAWRMRGIMMVRMSDFAQARASRLHMLQQGCAWLRHAVDIANDALSVEPDIHTTALPELKSQRYKAAFDYIQNSMMHDICRPSDEWAALLAYYVEAHNLISHNQREALNSVSWRALMLPLKNHDGPEFVRCAAIRSRVLTRLQASPVDKMNEFDDLPDLKSSVGAKFIEAARKEYQN